MNKPQLPQTVVFGLLLAQFLVLLAFVRDLPLWLLPLGSACLAWRWYLAVKQQPLPGITLRALLAVLLGVLVYRSQGSLFGLEGGSLLLLCAGSLKLLELRSRRDALLVIYLGLFAVAVSYLFNSQLLTALYSLLPITVLLLAWLGLYGAPQGLAALRLALKLLAQSLPIMLLLFVFFPRLGPLWALPQLSSKGLSGLAESMSPGDIAELSQSDAPAFRARFEGVLPARSQLYWRAMTLELFDGRRWSQAPDLKSRPLPLWSKEGTPLSYQITAPASGQPWLFSLDTPQLSGDDLQPLADFRYQRRSPIEHTLSYRAQSWPKALRELELSAPQQAITLQLPPGNPRSRAWAQQLKERYPKADQLASALLEHFHREHYFYTLKPPRLLQANTVDAFLFDSKRGFCAHYAGAMTFVLRAAGIPARVVAGYQGGEFNSQGGFVQVRQFDAHAWVEYWQAGRGWVTIDPTFAVAPQRIEQGLEQAVGADEFLSDALFSPLRYRNVSWLNELRYSLEQVDYLWQSWVLSYQTDAQQGLLQKWLGAADWRTLAYALALGGLCLASFLALWLIKPWQARSEPQLRLYQGFEKALARRGVRRAPGEGPQDFARRAALLLPNKAAAIEAFNAEFLAQRYAGRPSDLAKLKKLLRSF